MLRIGVLFGGSSVEHDVSIISAMQVLNAIDKSKYEIIDAGGKYIAPGLIDMHIHGYLGADASDGDAEGIKKMAMGIIKNGVTAWCPTTMTVSKKEIENRIKILAQEIDKKYGDEPLVFICVLKGAVVFYVKLTKRSRKAKKLMKQNLLMHSMIYRTQLLKDCKNAKISGKSLTNVFEKFSKNKEL